MLAEGWCTNLKRCNSVPSMPEERRYMRARPASRFSNQQHGRET